MRRGQCIIINSRQTPKNIFGREATRFARGLKMDFYQFLSISFLYVFISLPLPLPCTPAQNDTRRVRKKKKLELSVLAYDVIDVDVLDCKKRETRRLDCNLVCVNYLVSSAHIALAHGVLSTLHIPTHILQQ